MVTHMKTTLELPDDLLIAAKSAAARRRTTLKALVEHALRREIEPVSPSGSEKTIIERGPHGTPAEIESAIQRRRREATLPADQEVITREKLTVLSGMWQEVQATLAVRERALRLLRVHPLRAGDAFQLAAALIVCEEQTKGFYFHTSDERLAAAAAAEGFVVE